LSWYLDGKPIKSVLVTRLRYLGDIVMSTVVVQALKAGDPDLKIDYLCEHGYGEVLAGHPDIDAVHLLDPRRTGTDAKARVRVLEDQPTLGTWDMVRHLRAQNYDLAVDLFFNPRSAWLLRMAGIPLRMGGSRKWRRWLYTHTVLRDDPRCGNVDFLEHGPGGLGDHLCRLAPLVHGDAEVDFVSWLARQFNPGGLLPKIVRPPLDGRGRKGLAAIDCDPGQPFLLVAPGATWPTKQWPSSRWGEFLDTCMSRTTLPIAVLLPPGKEEEWKDLGNFLFPGRGGILPSLPLGSALGVVGTCGGLVTVDGGIMHAATAMGVPTVAIFGPTDPFIWFPYTMRPSARVVVTKPPCHPCDLHECDDFVCLPHLSAETVIEALDEVLSSQRGGLA